MRYFETMQKEDWDALREGVNHKIRKQGLGVLLSKLREQLGKEVEEPEALLGMAISLCEHSLWLHGHTNDLQMRMDSQRRNLTSDQHKVELHRKTGEAWFKGREALLQEQLRQAWGELRSTRRALDVEVEARKHHEARADRMESILNPLGA